MPLDTTAVGPQALPVDAETDNTALEDRTLLGLLDYLGFWLKDSLDAKLASQQGPTTSEAVEDACPVANRYPWNHQGTFVRRVAGTLPIPGLWAWEESQEPDNAYSTLLYEVVKREIRVQYIFPELSAPKGMDARHGLIPAVARIFAKAAERGRHSAYGFDGDAVNTAIWSSCDWRGFKYGGGRMVAAAMVPGSTQSQASQRAAGAEKRFYPSFLATFWIWERIQLQDTDEDEDLVAGDLTIDHGDDSDDETLPLMERVLPGSDDD